MSGRFGDAFLGGCGWRKISVDRQGETCSKSLYENNP